MPSMQNGVAAIRGARFRTRFILPQPHRRERRLGLDRAYRTSGAPVSASVAAASRRPLKEIRAAARRLCGNLPVSAPHGTGLGREPRMHWTPPTTGARAARTPGASAWRG
jgi:hypothetical protein